MDKLLLAVKILIAALVLILVVQNIVMVEVRFLTWSLRLPMAILLVVIYLLGMLTGKSLWTLIRRLRSDRSRRPG
ncbi:lipopolysaccharide assembly protein LapA domain-containing protein [Billgrantia montanilacus]|uniref:DUF1049 domain-containing protein n=1 Tax=Billgrantia montanilacus TaxID=2282305 RepID=A0A368TXR3_9GAMM|nr:lipopolysaccharide assembly protein LapA domain-containing protein [Halomonas montanilacus]RCV89478.1 DUF1049 domain-containing protein [Halomonas montanilacus]